jgi:hypothetical protein
MRFALTENNELNRERLALWKNRFGGSINFARLLFSRH